MALVRVQTGAVIGEIAQGVLSSGCPYLVSNLASSRFYSITTVEPNEDLVIDLGEKSSHACKLFLDRLLQNDLSVLPASFHISQYSNIPVGKGLSSSSADVLGALSALNKFCQNPFSTDELYGIAAIADPTDACLSPVLTVINQQTGDIISTFKHLKFSLIYFDSEPDIQVDTVQFTRGKQYSHHDYYFYEQLLHKLSVAANHNNVPDFLFWTSQSAVYNQKFLAKKHFDRLLSFAMKHRIGLFVAHSGTVMGLVVPGCIPDSLLLKSVAFIQSVWSSEVFVECCKD